MAVARLRHQLDNAWVARHCNDLRPVTRPVELRELYFDIRHCLHGL